MTRKSRKSERKRLSSCVLPAPKRNKISRSAPSAPIKHLFWQETHIPRLKSPAKPDKINTTPNYLGNVGQQDLMREELKIMQQSGRPYAPWRSFGFGIPQSEQTNVQTVSNPDLYDDPANVLYDPRRTSIELAGQRVDPNMNYSDAEIIEQRYGDVASWGYGLLTMGADGYKYSSGPERTQRVADRFRGSADVVGNFFNRATTPPPLAERDPYASGGTRNFATNRALYQSPAEPPRYPVPSL